MRLACVSSLLVCFPVPAVAQVEISLHFSAIQRALSTQVFTQDGRKYVKGSQRDKCNFAYLENPRVDAENARLRIQARFSGRSAMDLFGKCIGLGDSFELVILATPAYHKGAVVFTEVMVDALGQDSFYKRRVRRSIARSLSRDFSYPLAAEAKRILQDTPVDPGYRQELAGFDIASVRITPDAVVLTVAFRLAVK